MAPSPTFVAKRLADLPTEPGCNGADGCGGYQPFTRIEDMAVSTQDHKHIIYPFRAILVYNRTRPHNQEGI